MQVDVGDDRIHSNFSGIVGNPGIQSLQQSLKKEEVDHGSQRRASRNSVLSTSHHSHHHHRHHYESQDDDRGTHSDRSRDYAKPPRSPSHHQSESSESEERLRQLHHSSSRRRSHRRAHHQHSHPKSSSSRRASLKSDSFLKKETSTSVQILPSRTVPIRRPSDVGLPAGQSDRVSSTAAAAAVGHTSGQAFPLAEGPRRWSRDSGLMSNGGRAVVLSNGHGRPHGDDAVVSHRRGSNNNNNGGGGGANGSEGENVDDKENLKKDPTIAQKPGPRLAQTKIQPGMRLKRWMIISRIGAGSFGETFTAMEVDRYLPPLDPEDDPLTITPAARQLLENLPEAEERMDVCIKVEQENKNVLRLEALALKKVQPCPQVVRYLGSGCTNGLNFLVMEKLGPNLAELRRRSPHGTFNIYTTLKAGISCLQCIRGVHEQGLVHRDIKPSNFVTGLTGTEDEATCFIIDFGLARRYRRSNGDIRPPRENAGFRGTSRYASVTSHHHQELGRVDDLWSLLFMLVEFATGTLPWRKYKDKEDIGRCKEESITPHLVRNLPREFQPFLAHLQTLRYDDEPDYDLLLALMQRSLERRGYPRDKLVDWQLDPSMIEAADNEMFVQQPSQPPKAAGANGRAGGEGGDGGGTGPSRVSSQIPNPIERNASARVSSSQALPKFMSGSSSKRQQQQPHAEKGGSLTGSEAGDGELGRQQNSINGLRVSDVEVSYQRSVQQNEESRSNMGIGSQRAAAAGKHSVSQSIPIPAPRDEGSETPAPQASSSSHQAEAEELDHDNREFSPCEQGDDDAGPGGRHTPGVTAKPENAPGRAADHARPQPTGAILSPVPVNDVDNLNSLDAIEQHAHPQPPQQPGQAQKPIDKTPKVKSKCNCTIM